MRFFYRAEEFDPNFFYYSQVDIGHSFLVYDEKNPKKKKILLTSKMNAELAKTLFNGQIVIYDKVFEDLSRHLKNKEVFAPLGSISANLYLKMKKFCKMKDASNIFLTERSQKTALEVAYTKRAVRESKEILESIDFSKFKTELDVKKHLLRETLDRELEVAYDPIVATDKRSAFPHSKATTKKIGTHILIDFGVKYKGYCADLTRCFVLDKNPKKLQEYEKLKEILFTLVDELPILETGKDIATHSDDLLKKAGFPKLIHAIGHGVGLEIHEYPRLGFKSDDKLKGTTLAIEPAFYLKNYGMRFEETIYFDGKKARIL